MNIDAVWHRPINLSDGTKENLIFTIREELPESPGCYFFFNTHGNSDSILYIGRATRLNSRVWQQFTTNTRLMISIKKSKNGTKRLAYCTVKLKPGQKVAVVLELLERALIKHAFTAGHELLNIQGKNIAYHRISFVGNRTTQNLFGREMLNQIR
jgi:hypothetical protein